ncbi:hypothetical protein [Erwinia phage Pecta]|nr:hypothetical protein [Erwinia phage Pecta]
MYTTLSKIKKALFHPPYYRALKSPNPDNHLVFIECVEKAWGFTMIRSVSYTSDMFADSIVKGKNRTMKAIYGAHDVYEDKL